MHTPATTLCANRRILHAAPTLLARNGPLALGTALLCNALCRTNDEIKLAVVCQEGGHNPTTPLARDIQVLSVAKQQRFARVLKDFHSKTPVEIVHQHGIWLQSMRDVSAFARSRRIPLVLSLHGMLSPAMLRHRALQKKIDMLLYQRRDLKSATALHAATPAEVEQIRALRLRQPVILIPDGVTLPPADHCAVHPEQKKERTVLCLAQTSRKQDLETLLHAWANAAPQGWRLRIAGFEDNALQAQLQKQVNDLRIGESVELSGTLFGLASQHAYRSADLLVLPSAGPHLGEAVAEALARGLPVITLNGTFSPELESEGCGWFASGADGIMPLLQKAMALSPAERGGMGKKARALIERKYQWAAVGRNMLECYGWLLGERERPDCVQEA